MRPARRLRRPHEAPSLSLRLSFLRRRSMSTTCALSVVYVVRRSRSLSCSSVIRCEASSSGSVAAKGKKRRQSRHPLVKFTPVCCPCLVFRALKLVDS